MENQSTSLEEIIKKYKIVATKGFNAIMAMQSAQDKITNAMDLLVYTKALRDQPMPLKKIRAHVDAHVAQSIKTSEKKIDCKNGCAHCCYQPVHVSPAEASTLKYKLTPAQQAIINRQAKHLRAVPEISRYIELGENARCVFLSNANSCTVYEDRPLMCRIAMSTNVKTCNEFERPRPRQEILSSVEAEKTVTAYMNVTEFKLMQLELADE